MGPRHLRREAGAGHPGRAQGGGLPGGWRARDRGARQVAAWDRGVSSGRRCRTWGKGRDARDGRRTRPGRCAMTDTERIKQARGLLAEITHALDCAEMAMAQDHVAMREAALLAAMGAAEAVGRVLGGQNIFLDTPMEMR